MNNAASRFCLRVCAGFLLCLFLTALGGCEKFVLTSPSTGGAPEKRTPSPLEEARNALVAGDYATAEVLSQRLSQSSAPTHETILALRILAASATNNQHPNLALDSLERWRTLAPGADATQNWQDAWCLAAGRLPAREARNRANELYRDASRPVQIRNVAAVFLAVRQWEDGETGESLSTLTSIYNAASHSEKALMERRLATQLSTANPAVSALLAPLVNEENQGIYPYSIILIDRLHREARTPATQAEAKNTLGKLAGRIRLADPALFKGPPPASEPIPPIVAPVSPITSGPITGRPIVLALPLSGQFGNIATKIATGAELACGELSAGGNRVSLVVIDTEQPDWAGRVKGLPEEAAVIGGPLRTQDYATAKAQGLMAERAFFTFLPTLDAGDEGRVAWRFFSSPTDQVNALLAFTSTLGIRGYAAFYPDDAYGQRMARLFEESAAILGASVHATGYPPKAPTQWLRSAGTLLAANRNPTHGSAATFQAIFLPDSWKSAEVIIPNIFSYNEKRQLLLGSSLWEQGQSRRTLADPQYYQLALFPGGWNPSQPTPAGSRLLSLMQSAGKGQPDYWVGLGYDFARFAAALNITAVSSGSVNTAVQGVAIPWSIAPLRWDGAGRAEERLFLFTPLETGEMAPLDEAAFRAKFSEAWQ